MTSVSYEKDEKSGEYIYFYKFNLSKLIATQFRDNKDKLTDNFKMVLVPVTVQYDENNTVIGVKQKNTMSVTKISSGTHPQRPMKLKLIYSGI